MKRIGFILLAIAAIALLAPACSAQGIQTVNINGNVYSGALPIGGAKVQIYSWDGKDMGNAPLKTVTSSDGSNGIVGSFVFKNVPYDSSKAFNYVVKVDKDDRTAYAMVHIVPAEKSDEATYAEPIIIDLAMDSWVSDLTGKVQSGNLLANSLPIIGANVTIYERNTTSGEVLSTSKASSLTDSNGQFEIKNLPYGFYQAVIIKDNHIDKVNFTAYQQETHINSIMTGILLATPTPTPIPGSSGNKTGTGGFFGIPGFEAVLALIALTGTAFLLRKK